MVAATYGEVERAVERRKVTGADAAGLPFTQGDAGDPAAVPDLIVDRRGIPLHVDPLGEGVEPLAHLLVHEVGGVERNASADERFPALHALLLELRPDPLEQRWRLEVDERATRAPPELTEMLHGAAHARLVGMHRLAGDQRLRQRIERGIPELRREAPLHDLDVGLELKAEVFPPAAHRDALVLAGPADGDARRAPRGVLAHEIVGKRGALDGRAGNPEAVREEAQ